MRALLLLIFVALGLAGCGSRSEHWQLDDVEGHLPDLQFNLISDDDKPVTQSDYTGHVNLLFFGYTHCPDVCPVTLAKLHRVVANLGDAANGLNVLFISVDPARDTPQVLHEYVGAFGAHIVGLTGTPNEIKSLSKRYRVAFNRDKADRKGNYDVSHSSGVYIFDQRGRARLLATSSASVDALEHDLQALLKASS